MDLGGPKEAQVQSYSSSGANVHKSNRIRQVAPVPESRRNSSVSCAKTAESIDLVGRRKHKFKSSIVFARWRQCTLMRRHIWRRLANTIELFRLLRITLTTCTEELNLISGMISDQVRSGWITRKPMQCRQKRRGFRAKCQHSSLTVTASTGCRSATSKTSHSESLLS